MWLDLMLNFLPGKNRLRPADVYCYYFFFRRSSSQVNLMQRKLLNL
jgi:hypothetical protein